jgi:hypothetical protein
MIFFILILIFLIYFYFSYHTLLNQENTIQKIKSDLISITDKRFKIFEELIDQSLKFINYEETFFSEIVQLRSQAQKHKQDKDDNLTFWCEEKISQLALKINLLVSEYPTLNRIENIKDYQEKILIMESNFSDLKKEYNLTIKKYNELKNSPIHYLTAHIFKRFYINIESWKITP